MTAKTKAFRDTARASPAVGVSNSTPKHKTITVDPLCADLGLPDRYVSEDIASTILGMSKKWLRLARYSGEYPELEYVKWGNAVRYRLSSIYKVAESRTISNTSTQPAG